MEIKRYYCNICKERKPPGTLTDLELNIKSKNAKYFYGERHSEEYSKKENLFFCGDLCPNCLVIVKNMLRNFAEEKLKPLIPEDLDVIDWEK